MKKEIKSNSSTVLMEAFFTKVRFGTWKIKVSDIVEQNGGGCSFGFFPRTKSARVAITVDNVVEVEIHQKHNDKSSVQLVYDQNTTTVEFKYLIDPDRDMHTYMGYGGQEMYYTFLSGFIYIKQNCKFVVHVSFIDRQDNCIVNDCREFSTTSFFTEITASETSVPEIQCVICLKNKIEFMYSECSHFCVCSECVCSIDRCPICRCENSKWVKVYLP